MTLTADHLDLQPPGSMLDWRIYDDGFIAGNYRIHLLDARRWQVMCGDDVVGEYRSLKTAFATCEHHLRNGLRRSAIQRHGLVAVLALVAWLLVDVVFALTGDGYVTVALFPVVFVGVAAAVRCLASAIGGVNPYAPRSLRDNALRK